jgi:MFS family permease
MGFVNAIFVNSIWPVVPLVVPMKYCGLAIGIMNSVSTVAMTIVPLVVPALYNSSNERYIPNVLLFFGIISLISAFVGLYWVYNDHNTGLLCSSPEKGVGNPSFIGDHEEYFGTGSPVLRPEGIREQGDLGAVSSVLYTKEIHAKESGLAPKLT